ncbi:hypothetical protein TSST111916_21255 [Tsukamurella strandjordii]
MVSQALNLIPINVVLPVNGLNPNNGAPPVVAGGVEKSSFGTSQFPALGVDREPEPSSIFAPPKPGVLPPPGRRLRS